MREVWKDIVGYEGLYQVSNLGRVKGLERVVMRGSNFVPVKEKIMTLRFNQRGYLIAHLTKEGVQKQYMTHRLVAQAFISNPENKPQVNHINEVKDDNRVENLEWVTAKENINHGTYLERRARSQSKPIKRINIATGEEKAYPSQVAVELDGFRKQSVHRVLKGWRNSYLGYKWEYVSGVR